MTSIENHAGAQSVERVLTDEVQTELLEQVHAGRLSPAGALTYLQAQKINTQGIDRLDIAEWILAQPEPKKKAPAKQAAAKKSTKEKT